MKIIVTVESIKKMTGQSVVIRGVCEETDWKGYNHSLNIHHHIGKSCIITDKLLFGDGSSCQYYWGLEVELDTLNPQTH